MDLTAQESGAIAARTAVSYSRRLEFFGFEENGHQQELVLSHNVTPAPGGRRSAAAFASSPALPGGQRAPRHLQKFCRGRLL